jgi:hypothetical protein
VFHFIEKVDIAHSLKDWSALRFIPYKLAELLQYHGVPLI